MKGKKYSDNPVNPVDILINFRVFLIPCFRDKDSEK